MSGEGVPQDERAEDPLIEEEEEEEEEKEEEQQPPQKKPAGRGGQYHVTNPHIYMHNIKCNVPKSHMTYEQLFSITRSYAA